LQVLLRIPAGEFAPGSGMHLRQLQGRFNFLDESIDLVFTFVGKSGGDSDFRVHGQAAFPEILDSHGSQSRLGVGPAHEPVQVGFQRQKMFQPFLQGSQFHIQLGGFETPDEVVKVELPKKALVKRGGEGG